MYAEYPHPINFCLCSRRVEKHSINKFADNLVVYLDGFRKALGLASQTFDAGAEVEILAFNGLSIAFSDQMLPSG